MLNVCDLYSECLIVVTGHVFPVRLSFKTNVRDRQDQDLVRSTISDPDNWYHEAGYQLTLFTFPLLKHS